MEAFHVEGPYISAEDGPRGAHPARWVRPPDLDEFHRFQEAAGGHIRLVTLSPEWPQAPRFIEAIVRRGRRRRHRPHPRLIATNRRCRERRGDAFHAPRQRRRRRPARDTTTSGTSSPKIAWLPASSSTASTSRKSFLNVALRAKGLERSHPDHRCRDARRVPSRPIQTRRGRSRTSRRRQRPAERWHPSRWLGPADGPSHRQRHATWQA